jgi:hypothetical protein
MAGTPAVLSTALALAAGALSLSGCTATTTVHRSGQANTTDASPAPSTALPPNGGQDPATSQTPVTGNARCQTSQLRAALSSSDAGAGNRYLRLTLRNVGPACRMSGWAGLQLEGSSAARVPTQTVRTGTPTAFTVPSGGTATAQLHWTVMPTGSEPQTGQCEPLASQLHVYPPGQTTARTPAWTYGPVCGHGRFDVTPMHP